MRSPHFLQAAALLITAALPGIHSFLLPRSHDWSSPLDFVTQQQTSFLPSSGRATDHHKFTVREQNDSVCNAGVKQWTGLVNVSEEKKLFFWLFESRHDPENDPVIIWINGGPGGTSMFGLFREIGACLILDRDFNSTEFNVNSWSNFANVLYIDQPAGVGFSTINNGSLGGPGTLLEAAIDFEKLLFTIFTDIFPQFSNQPLHVAGESFAGHYIPSFVQYIHMRQKMVARNALQIPIKSIILVDAVLDMTTSGIGGQYEHFCARDLHGNLKEGGFNETACTSMEADTPACERLVRGCIDSYDRNLCSYADQFCTDTLGRWFEGDIVAGGRNPYDDRKKCVSNPPLCEDSLGGPLTAYLNQPHVQEALGFENFNFSSINYDINERFSRSGDTAIPTTREVSYILDETEIDVLSINGNNDIIQNTEGQLRVYEALPWSKQALFRVRPLADWFWPSKSGPEKELKLEKGGQMKKAGKLSFVTVDNAGHTSPGDAPESVSYIVECWVRGKGSDGVDCP